MSEPVHLKSSFDIEKSLEEIYTGGKVVVTKDNKTLITTIGEDVRIMDLESGQIVHTLEGEADVVTCLVARPEGNHLVTASRSLLLRIWEIATGKEIRSWKAHQAPVLTMDFDPTSTLVATGSADSTIKLWDVDRGFCTHNLTGHSGIVSIVKFHPNAKQLKLVSGADDCTIRIWDLTEKRCISVLDSHVSVIRGLDFTKDGSQLISCARDKVVNLWDFKSGNLLKTLPILESVEAVGVLTAAPHGVQASKDDLFIYTGGDKGFIRIWNVRTGQCVAQDKSGVIGGHTIMDVQLLKSRNQLMAVTSDQNLFFFNGTTLDKVKQIVGYNDEILDATFVGPDHTKIAVATNSEQIRIFDLETTDCEILQGHKEMVISLDKSSDGTLLISGSKDHRALVWRMNEHSKFDCVGECVGHTEAVGAVAFSRRFSSFAVTGSQDRTIKVWDLSTIADDHIAKLKTLYTFQAHEKDINSIAIAPNDKVFATGSQDKTAKIWSVSDGSLLGVCKGHKRGVWCVEFSPVDQVLATSSGDKTIKLWSIRDFTCLKTLEGHLNSVLRVRFISMGMQLVSSGSDGLVKLWTIKTSECVETLDKHEDKVWALSVRKDEKQIASGGVDSAIHLWKDVTIEKEEQKQAENENKVLKEQDLSNFLLKKDYRNAVLLALELRQPMRLLKIFSQLIEAKDDSDSLLGSKALELVLGNLEDDKIELLLLYVRDWNTNTKHSQTSQAILRVVLEKLPQERILGLAKSKEILEALLPYTERHYQHADQLMSGSYLIDYTLHAMDNLLQLDENLEDEMDDN
ncbi:WD40-repeat-containing domain protein [Polychytrium aggregatum]|uniref:WD40-repeat-containing domain protein n=1 Tax=Polychytrium aggregatum TaxID=110093 RepID=UPI0022FE91C6|nr:WD40-repeat-containing domain protein [Polychytrium aggregatum]KAI9203824.1 WD40-repeat-containing domain protein [Polychytrium aggregatum]